VYRNLIVAITLFLSGHVSAHEWTPTYPELTPSHVEGVVYTDMLLLNRRQDIRYYEISVWDEEWNRVPFASEITGLCVGWRVIITVDVSEQSPEPQSALNSQ